MVFIKSEYDTMLQIVPSAGFSPPSSSDYSVDYSCDNIDFSLLPGSIDNDYTFSNGNTAGGNNVQQFLSLYCDVNSPSPLFPVYDTCTSTKDITDNLLKGMSRGYDYNAGYYRKNEPVSSSFDKINPPSYCNTNNNNNNYKDDTAKSSSSFLDQMEMTDWDCKNDWDNIRVQSSISSVTSSSNCSSPDFQLCPSTPPDFDTIMPLDDGKQEITMNLQSLLAGDNGGGGGHCNKTIKTTFDKKPELLRSILEKSPLNEPKTGSTINTSNNAVGASSDDTLDNHKLIREMLKDTSFQKKYNLRPFDIEGLGTGYQSSEIKIEQCEVQTVAPVTTATSASASSSPSPRNLAAVVAPTSTATIAVPAPSNSITASNAISSSSTTTTLKEDVCDVNLTEGIIAPVLSKAIEQLMQDVDNTSVMLGIPRDPKKWSVDDVRSWLQWNSRQHNLPISMDLFNITGASLTSMSEQDFQQRVPQSGNLLYAQLEIWKVNSMEDTHLDVNTLLCDTNTQSSPSIDISDEDDEEDEDMTDVSPNYSPTMSSGIKVAGRGSGSHIHLWQFLKELLSSPQTHGTCIRWLDRNKGVFKIEDSVRVARLWGKRKNRPAMNYDKLSRSIRQYYKKGIMKKTERSQRLVYQFCTPYNL